MSFIRCGMTLNILIVILTLLSCVSCAKVQLYKDANFTDLVTEIKLTEKDTCFNIQYKKSPLIHSIITDTCVMAYNHPNCRAAWSSKFKPGKMIANDESLGYFGVFKSLHKCNDEEGGSKLNVDITHWFGNTYPPALPNVIEKYKDVCSCINIPENVKSMPKWSIDNHGNGLFAYFEPDCKELLSKPLYINAGQWINSRDMHEHSVNVGGNTLKIQSLGPASNCTYFEESCLALKTNDKIMRLELFENLNSSSNFKVDNNLGDGDSVDLMTLFEDDEQLIFFAENNYKGFQFRSRSTLKCNNFSKPIQSRWPNGIGSLFTKSCVLLYSDYDCMGRSIKIEVPGNSNLTSVWESTVTGERTLSLLYTKYPNWKWETKSYHLCNNEKEGSILNVDIVSSDPSVITSKEPVILESYNKLCSCRKVSEYVQELDTWFVENHGNEMMAYFSPDCSSSTFAPLWIPAGQSSYSMGLGQFKQINQSTGVVHKIQSIGPDPISGYFRDHCNKSCTKVSSIINENVNKINKSKVCDFETKSESVQISLIVMESVQMIISELKNLSEKVDELGRKKQKSEEN